MAVLSSIYSVSFFSVYLLTIIKINGMQTVKKWVKHNLELEPFCN